MMLDVGSGYGHVAEAIFRDAPDRSCVLLEPGYDLSPRVARRIAGYTWQALRGDGRHLPFADATFDAAWALFVLHHVEVTDQTAILREVGRVLRPGGVFVLAEDTPRTPKSAPMRCALTGGSISSRPARHTTIAVPTHGAARSQPTAFGSSRKSLSLGSTRRLRSFPSRTGPTSLSGARNLRRGV